MSPIAIHDLSSPSHARIVAGFDALAKTERLRDGFMHDSNNTYLSLVDRHFDSWLTLWTGHYVDGHHIFVSNSPSRLAQRQVLEP